MNMKTPPSEDPTADFGKTLMAFLGQVGYESDNTIKGVKSASKDYEAVLKQEPPAWINEIWPSTALSVLHLAIAKRTLLPEKVDYPNTALKSKTMFHRKNPDIQYAEF